MIFGTRVNFRPRVRVYLLFALLVAANGRIFAQPLAIRLQPRQNPTIDGPGATRTEPRRSPSDRLPPIRRRTYSRDELLQMSEAAKTVLPDISLGEGILPPDPSADGFPARESLANVRTWTPLTYQWAPSEVWSHPLYFEDVML